jgi:hypothetical protein
VRGCSCVRGSSRFGRPVSGRGALGAVRCSCDGAGGVAGRAAGGVAGREGVSGACCGRGRSAGDCSRSWDDGRCCGRAGASAGGWARSAGAGLGRDGASGAAGRSAGGLCSRLGRGAAGLSSGLAARGARGASAPPPWPPRCPRGPPSSLPPGRPCLRWGWASSPPWPGRTRGGSWPGSAGSAWAKVIGSEACGGRAEAFADSSMRGRAVLARNRLEIFMILNFNI